MDRNATVDVINFANEQFKAGRRAGWEDVALQILQGKPEDAHQYAEQYLQLARKRDV